MPIGTSRAPYVKFEKPGDRHGGEIVDFRVVQKTDIDTDRPLYFVPKDQGGGKTFDAYGADGRAHEPICQWEVTVDTGVEDDNGDTERRMFIDPQRGKKGTALEGKRGGDAIAIAMKKAKAHRVGPEIGGTLFVTYHGKIRADRKSPETNTWSAEYTPPAGGPGSGTPVDEVPWLVGGGRFNPNERAEPVATTPSFDNGPRANLDAGADTRTAVGAGGSAAVAYDEDPPF